ncbi:hypothetical protein CMV60_20040 [Serratia marcescens]|nr:hypothetical protein CMV60_20040 [Serratia marcescens]
MVSGSDNPLQLALTWVSDAYLLHLVAMHRRPVYRHANGDIAVNRSGIEGFIDGYLRERWSPLKRAGMYMRMLDIDAMCNSKTGGYFVHWGEVPQLKPRGRRFIDAMFERYGEMVQELGGEGATIQWVKEHMK